MRLILFREVNAIYSENHTKPINRTTICRRYVIGMVKLHVYSVQYNASRQSNFKVAMHHLSSVNLCSLDTLYVPSYVLARHTYHTYLPLSR